MLISPGAGRTFQDRVLQVAVPTLGKEELWELTCEAKILVPSLLWEAVDRQDTPLQMGAPTKQSTWIV